MAFDIWHITKAGPGVDENEPRKKGIRRFLELLGRDGSAYLRANLVCMLAFLPGTVAVCYGVYSGSIGFVLFAGALGGIPAGIALQGMYDTVLRTLRDEANFWWPTWRRAVRASLRLSIPTGALLGATLGMAGFLYYWKLRGAAAQGIAEWWAPALYLLVFAMLFSSLLPQLALLDVSFLQLLKNSLLFMLGALPRVLAAALIAILYWGATLTLFPYSLLFLPLFGFWLVTLLSCMLVYPPLDAAYQVEKTLRERAAQQDENEENG